MSGPHLVINSQSTTEGPVPPENTEIVVKPAPPIRRIEHDHHRSRFFLGPMPEKVMPGVGHSQSASNQQGGLGNRIGLTGRRAADERQRKSLSSEEAVSRSRALRFFVSRGGKPEDFDREESSIKGEIFKMIQSSRWFQDGRDDQKKTSTTARKWVGDTFEIGKDVLGLSTLATQEEEPPVIGRGSISGIGPATSSPGNGAKPFSDEFAAAIPVLNPGPTTSQSAAASALSVAGSTHKPSVKQEPDSTSTRTSRSSPHESASSRTRLVPPPSTSPGSGSNSPKRPGIIASALSAPAVIRKASSSSSLRDVVKSVSFAIHPKDTSLSKDSKGKGKAHVTFSETAGQPNPPSSARSPEILASTPELEPISPEEVLTREATPTTSAGAAAHIQEELEPDNASGVLLRDRMLVRVLSTRGGVQKYLDEQQLLEMPEAKKDRATMWREYLVVWNKSYIELYEPYTLQVKEWVKKHKHLAFQIPILQTKTKVSVFSRVDMSFCVTCPKISAHFHASDILMSHEDKEVTMIFILKPKSRSRSIDWYWRLWRKLGGEIPESIEIRCPVIDARVNFPIPIIDLITGLEGYKSFTRDRVIQICREQMSGIPEWDLLIESALRAGQDGEEGRLELCWRTGSQLDWTYLEDDIDGKPRPWALLFGVALFSPRSISDLELRVAEHFPTKIALGNGITMHEPPAVEGYLYRYKTETLNRDPVYLTTHNGNIFFLPQDFAYPPEPPTTSLQEGNETEISIEVPGGGVSGLSEQNAGLITRSSEIQRGASQILYAKYFLDMRNVESVKRATEPLTRGLLGANAKRERKISIAIRERRHSTTTDGTSTDATHAFENETVETAPERSGNVLGVDEDEAAELQQDDLTMTEDDIKDEGGDEVLDALNGEDKVKLKTRRSFELVMRNGEIIRFEAYSCKNCLEWVSNLRSLVSYWTGKHRIDARLEMDIVHSLSGRTRFLVPRAGERVFPAPPPDPREASPLLGRWWHWCVLEGCRSIIRCGRLFMRTTSRGQMRHYYFVLVSGHLIRFRLTSSGTRSLSVLHSHAKTINLLDAYVTSGYFAALELDEGNRVFEPIARRYQDGLETDDADVDTLIIIRYRILPVDNDLKQQTQFASTKTSLGPTSQAMATTTTNTTHTGVEVTGTLGVPALDSKHKMLVLRARSKLERDAWCWALNAEIERLVRIYSPREEAVRNDGRIRTSS